METPSQDFFNSFWECLSLPLSRFRDESTRPRISLAALPQWYEDSYPRSLDDIQRYHPP